MKRFRILAALAAAAALAAPAIGQDKKPLSPHGTAATQVGGHWETDKDGESRYTGGKWIEVEYSRPIKRGRADLYGSGADYGKKLNAGAPVWRAGANAATKLTTEVPIEINGKKLAAGSYDLFVELKESGWTLIVSTQPTQDKYDPADKAKIWGSYAYDPKFDVVRMPMTMKERDHSVDQFTIAFLDMTENGGLLALAWDRQTAVVPFTVSK